jgi:hypothetical protein
VWPKKAIPVAVTRPSILSLVAVSVGFQIIVRLI